MSNSTNYNCPFCDSSIVTFEEPCPICSFPLFILEKLEDSEVQAIIKWEKQQWEPPEEVNDLDKKLMPSSLNNFVPQTQIEFSSQQQPEFNREFIEEIVNKILATKVFPRLNSWEQPVQEIQNRFQQLENEKLGQEQIKEELIVPLQQDIKNIVQDLNSKDSDLENNINRLATEIRDEIDKQIANFTRNQKELTSTITDTKTELVQKIESDKQETQVQIKQLENKIADQNQNIAILVTQNQLEELRSEITTQKEKITAIEGYPQLIYRILNPDPKLKSSSVGKPYKTVIPSLEEYNFSRKYNQNPQTFADVAIKVNTSEDSINYSRAGGNQQVVLATGQRGNYWIIQEGRYQYLVPKVNLKINQFNYNTATILFECRGYEQSELKEFELLVPANVISGSTPEEWILQSTGVLEFKI